MSKAVAPEKRSTAQRRVILEELRKTSAHPTAEEVHSLARKRLPRISLGTVYRNLEGLASEGVVLRLDTNGTRKRFDGNPARHYHIHCVRCGRVDDVPVQVDQRVDTALRGRTEYRVLGHRLEFDGVCPRCRKKRSLNG